MAETKPEKITMTGDAGDTIELYVLESTKLGGKDYILATDAEDGDGECYIFEDKSAETDAESCYELVTDDAQLDYLLGVFAELIEDTDFEFDTEK